MKTEGGDLTSLFYPETRCSSLDDKDEEMLSQLSDLPDDVLISILSLLPLKDATSTSILSPRWRHLHTYVTRLDFPAFNHNSENIIEMIPKHVAMIDGVLRSHRGGRVTEMKVQMSNLEGATVANWFEFAYSRGVEVLDISCTMLSSWDWDLAPGNYSLGLSKSLMPIRIGVRELSLVGVQVNEQDCDLLISSFDALETLRIENSNHLKNVSIVGHPKLKHLHLSRIESLEIRDLINLVSLRCREFTRECSLYLQNLPNLIQFSTTATDSTTECATTGLSYLEILAQIPSCIRSQLQLLNISTPLAPAWPFSPPPFLNTKHMELEVNIGAGCLPVYDLIPLIEACPSLEKLKIKFVCSEWHVEDIMLRDNDDKAVSSHAWRSDQNFKVSPKLKVVEFTGYVGSTLELELAAYITQNAAALEQFILIPRDGHATLKKQPRRQIMPPIWDSRKTIFGGFLFAFILFILFFLFFFCNL